MLTEEFNYILPAELIAQNPAFPRDQSRLMVLDRKERQISNLVFADIASLLKRGDVLVFNQSKVIPARINFDIWGKEAEILLVRKLAKNEWSAMVKPGKSFKPGVSFDIDENVSARVNVIMEGGLRKIEFIIKKGSFDRYIYKIGKAPFPPYIRNSNAKFEDYQTVYAVHEGSVAAPTAGLHFTNNVFSRLSEVGVEKAFVTLHIGPGTFLPVKADVVDDHVMHSEWFDIDKGTADFLNEAKRMGRRIIAVGTTAVRVLETNFSEGIFRATQDETDIFISPGYKWKCVDGLLTNFHLPKSTLMMLVCSFGGKDFVMNAYREAVRERYRFYSFGDAMLII